MAENLYSCLFKLKATVVFDDANVKILLKKEVSLKELAELSSSIEMELGIDAKNVKVEPTTSGILISVPPDSFLVEDDEGVWYTLTDKVSYKVKDDTLYLGHRTNGKYKILRKFPMDAIRSLFNELPNEFTSDDVVKTAEKLGLNVNKIENYLMHVFANYVEFGCEFANDTRKFVLKKPYEDSVWGEKKKELALEKEVIGSGIDEI